VRAALAIVLALLAHAVRPPVSRGALQDVLEYLPPSAHALGWQHEGVAARWYAPGQGAPRAAASSAWQDCTSVHRMNAAVTGRKSCVIGVKKEGRATSWSA
jgi:hypothetical protein